jgi:hypothetical protein
MQPGSARVLQEGVAKRLASMARRKLIGPQSEGAAAGLLVSLAHDWALRHALAHGTTPLRDRDLLEMVDVLWKGLQAR